MGTYSAQPLASSNDETPHATCYATRLDPLFYSRTHACKSRFELFTYWPSRRTRTHFNNNRCYNSVSRCIQRLDGALSGLIRNRQGVSGLQDDRGQADRGQVFLWSA